MGLNQQQQMRLTAAQVNDANECKIGRRTVTAAHINALTKAAVHNAAGLHIAMDKAAANMQPQRSSSECSERRGNTVGKQRTL
jgi:hypothetical protein